MRIISDIIGFTAEKMPRFNSISISGYHMQEAGRDAGAGAGLHPGGRARIRARRDWRGGMDVDAFAPRLSFFFAIGMNVFMEAAKLRAARLLWARIMDEFDAEGRAVQDAAHPLPDLGRQPAGAGPLQQRGADGLRGDGGGAGRHAVAAHQCAGRGDRAADRLLGPHRAQHPADPAARDRRICDVVDPLAGSATTSRN